MLEERRLLCVLIVQRKEILATASRWAKGFPRCGFTTAPATGCISPGVARWFTCCCSVAINRPRNVTSSVPWKWRAHYPRINTMTNFTPFDVADYLDNE